MNKLLKLVLTLLISVLLAYLVMWFSKIHLESVSSYQAQQLENLSEIILIEDAKRTAQLFRYADQFEFLSIKSNNDDVYYRFIKHPSELSWLFHLLESWNYLPAAKTIAFEELQVEFRLSYEESLYLLQFLLILSATLPWLILLGISIVQFVKKQDFATLENAILSYLNMQQDNSRIPESIQLAIDTKLPKLDDESKELNTKYDPITGMLTGEQFTKEYESIRQELGKQSAIFVLLRVKNLKQINFKHGFQAGDDFMSILSGHIRELVPDRHDKLYRLNGIDFAMVIRNSSVENSNTLVANIKLNLQERVHAANKSVQLGSATIEFNQHTSLQVLLSTADSLADHSRMDN